MSLATRCTACDTVFRVVQDQLKVSEGWVRCGHCHEVFSALEGLFDLEHDIAAPAPAAPVPESTAGDAAPGHRGPPAAAADLTRDKQLFLRERAQLEHTPTEGLDERDRIDFADAQFNTALLAEAGFDEAENAADGSALLAPAEDAAPEFVRQAEARARRHSPAARRLGVLAALLLLAGLALQGVYHFRDVLAARWPATRPALEAGCELARCRIEPLRRLDDMLVESTALTLAPAGDAFRLAVVLRNRGPLAVVMPFVELSLTDADGQMVARRALSPADFRVTDPVLPAGADASLQLVLAAASRATGYTVEVFYP